MKRDLTLVRKLLLILEDPQRSYADNAYGLSVWSPTTQYHLRMLVEADFACGYGYALNGAVSLRLTWRGHELLELSRDETIWRRAIQSVQHETGGNCLETILTVLRRWHAQRASQSETWLPQAHATDQRPNWAPLRWRPKPAPVPASTPTKVVQVGRPTEPIGFQLDVLRGQHDDALPVYLL